VSGRKFSVGQGSPHEICPLATIVELKNNMVVKNCFIVLLLDCRTVFCVIKMPHNDLRLKDVGAFEAQIIL
jgi:hypothetical protein